MDYASSFAVGRSALNLRDDTHAPHTRAAALPAPRPHRVHWSTIVFTAGMAICALALLLTIAGVPGALGYDVDAAPNRNKPTSADPLALTRSMEGNLSWVAQATNDEPGNYAGLITSINRHELAIGAMVGALTTMDASVKAIDAGLGSLSASTATMGTDIEGMSTTSTTTAATMTTLGGDIGFLSKSMVELADSTQQLTTRMSAIEQQAGAIASGGTSVARASAKDLNAALPQGVPAATTTDGEPYEQAIKRLATGGGANTDGARFQ